MSKVKLLPPEIISKIAAGEVIERPSSVVKELLENSIDAEATEISITVKEGGRSLIKIKDNGAGISKEDMEIIFRRHATSKISSVNDLYNIKSFGFRGEALYSIASISDITLKSKEKNGNEGWQIHLRGGKKVEMKPAPIQAGTEIEVQELFFNTPARRKFLKRTNTELNHIISTFIPYVIYNHSIKFRLTTDYKFREKILYNLYPANDIIGRMTETLNIERKNIIAAEAAIPERGINIKLFLGDTNIRRSSKELQFIYINKRPVTNRLINFKVNDTYNMIFPKEIYPFFLIDISVPESQIDANVHPSKKEVKIEREYDIVSKICSAIKSSLINKGKPLQIEISSSVVSASSAEYGHKAEYGAEKSPAYVREATENLIKKSSGDKYMPEPDIFRDTGYEFPFTPPAGNSETENEPVLKKKLNSASYIGQAMKKYLLFETENSILVIDQHAAQEKINYETLKKKMEEGSVEIQYLLEPTILRLTKKEFLVWENLHKKLEKLGFQTTIWNGDTIAVHSTPNLIKDPAIAIMNILSEVKEEEKYDDSIIARKACRSSVMFGDKVTKEEAEWLVKRLAKLDNPFTCPHGRPTIIEVTDKFLMKKFLRE